MHTVIIEWPDDALDTVVHISEHEGAVDVAALVSVLEFFDAIVPEALSDELRNYLTYHPLDVNAARQMGADDARAWLAAMHECDGTPWLTFEDVDPLPPLGVLTSPFDPLPEGWAPFRMGATKEAVLRSDFAMARDDGMRAEFYRLRAGVRDVTYMVELVDGSESDTDVVAMAEWETSADGGRLIVPTIAAAHERKALTDWWAKRGSTFADVSLVAGKVWAK